MRFLAIATILLTSLLCRCFGITCTSNSTDGVDPSWIANSVATVNPSASPSGSGNGGGPVNLSATPSGSGGGTATPSANRNNAIVGTDACTIADCPSDNNPASAPASPPPRVASATGTDLVIVNNSGVPNSAVYIYAIGSGGQYLQAGGSLASAGAANIPSLPLAASGPTVFPLPYMTSARIYISLNAPLHMGNGVQPDFGPDNTQLFDFVELNYAAGSLFINTSQVDMFSLPTTIQVVSPQGTQTVGIPDGARTSIFAAFQADPILKTLILAPGGTDLRILSPDHGILDDLFPSTFLDAYIDQVWTYYETHTLSLNGWKGNTVNGSMVFTQGGQTVPIQKPTSTIVFECAFDAAANGFANEFCAGLNRGTLLDGAAQPDYNAADFYQTIPTNGYAKIIHQFAINGKAYAFPYDDAGPFSSIIGVSNPTTVTLTLSSF